MAQTPDQSILVDDFQRPDSFYHGNLWESLNPGYWKLENNALRRRLENRGDKARNTGFPYHWETHQKQPMPMDYDPSLPFGMIWRRDWNLSGNYSIEIKATVLGLRPENPEHPEWMQHQPGYALFGLCFGGKTLYESWDGGSNSGKGAWMAAWRDDGRFGVYDHATAAPEPAQPGAEQPAPALEPGQSVRIRVTVSGDESADATVTATLIRGSTETTVVCTGVDRAEDTDGYFGLVARGLLDFEVNEVSLAAGANKPINAAVNDLHVCYALGDTLVEKNDGWHCTFAGLFRSDGNRAALRISDSEDPAGGWENVPVAAEADIINNEFRRNTAIFDALLPHNPAEGTLYYTVWKDGRNVTSDPREGFLGRKDYVGRLPQLSAPYRIAGLGGHAIHGGGPNLPEAGKFEKNWVHEQPTPDAYQYLEDYDFQVMLWEDDVWYLELLLYPPSIDDAYKIITTTIAGPTGRWAMMRHWNVLNPGDHDHGMDDVKGPEQYIIRQHDDLGQDPEYMRRNFQIVSHLVSGDEAPSGVDNPKRWRRWKMPDRDFSLLVTDARLWRTSQDTNIWEDEGWGHKKNLYNRHDPTRTLLGEEQFAWLSEMIRTDTSPLICVSGINVLHPIWSGYEIDEETGLRFAQRDRVAADYAGWVTAGADRVIELLGSRQGMVTVFGDIHLASIIENVDQRLVEASFGPIGRTGSRAPKEDFGPTMTDYDGRSVKVIAVYHDKYEGPELEAYEGPKIWNLLEMKFDPRGEAPAIDLAIRNLIDAPSDAPRGGGAVHVTAGETGRRPVSALPPVTTLPNADVLLVRPDGRPVRGARSLDDGTLPLDALIDVEPGTTVVVTAFDGGKTSSQLVTTTKAE